MAMSDASLSSELNYARTLATTYNVTSTAIKSAYDLPINELMAMVYAAVFIQQRLDKRFKMLTKFIDCLNFPLIENNIKTILGLLT